MGMTVGKHSKITEKLSKVNDGNGPCLCVIFASTCEQLGVDMEKWVADLT